MKHFYKKGQINFGVMFAGFSLLASVFGGISWGAFGRADKAVDKADKALEKVTDVAIQLSGIEGKLDILLLKSGVPQSEIENKLTLASSSQSVNGHK